MDRVLALRSEIFGGLDDAGPEEVLPHPIDLHPRGQRVLGHEQPAGKAESIGGAALWAAAAKKLGVANETFSAGWRYSPRLRIDVWRGFASLITMTRGSLSAW